MPKYRERPVEVDAIQWTGENTRAVGLWVEPDLAMHALPKGWWVRHSPGQEPRLVVPTVDGEQNLRANDWIVKGANGDFYPCAPDIFAAMFEEVV